jgi:hypothetical protein
MTNIVSLVQPSNPDYYDVASALRNIADSIEAGEYGEVLSCGVVLAGNTLEVFGAGPDSEAPMMVTLFNSASFRFVRDLEALGRDE